MYRADSFTRVLPQDVKMTQVTEKTGGELDMASGSSGPPRSAKIQQEASGDVGGGLFQGVGGRSWGRSSLVGRSTADRLLKEE